MTSGWDAVRRVALAEPWQDFWVEVYLDPPMGHYLDIQAAARQAVAVPSQASVDALIGAMRPLVAAHNMTGRDGAPIEWGVATMGSRLVVSIKEAILAVVSGDGGASADPLPPAKTRRASSRGPASPARRSPPSTRSGASRA